MGQDICTSITLPPLSLHGCIVNGKITITWFIYNFHNNGDIIHDDKNFAGINMKIKLNNDNKLNVSIMKHSIERYNSLVRENY